MSTTKVKQGKEHNVQANVTQSKALIDVTNSNASNIEMTLTIIPDLYLVEQDPMSSGGQLMWWIPS
jgi:hypothetical protein